MTCKNCDSSVDVPKHCGRAMEIVEENNEKYWQCWKGDHPPCCGREATVDYEACCKSPELYQTMTHNLI